MPGNDRRQASPKRYLPMQKSRKITSRTSSTSTRPVRRPNARPAIRNSSAKRSSLPERSRASARRKAARVSSNARRCLSRVTSADSPAPKALSACCASLANSASKPSPVVAEILNISSLLLNLSSLLSVNPELTILPNALLVCDFSSFFLLFCLKCSFLWLSICNASTLLNTTQIGGDVAADSGPSGYAESVASTTHSTKSALAARARARITPSRSTGLSVSRIPAVSSSVTGNPARSKCTSMTSRVRAGIR